MAKRVQKKGIVSSVLTDDHPEFMVRLSGFYLRHKDAFGYLLVAVIMFAAVSTLMILNNRTKEREASVKFQSAVTLYNSSLTRDLDGDDPVDTDPSAGTDTTVNKLQEIIDNYPGTSSSRNALYLMGNVYLKDGKYPDAISTLDRFISENSEHILIPNCFLSKATAQFNSGDIKLSLKTLQFLEQNYPGFLLQDVLTYEIAKRHLSLSQWQKARDKFQSVIDDYPDSPWSADCKTRIDKINREHSSPDAGSEEIS